MRKILLSIIFLTTAASLWSARPDFSIDGAKINRSGDRVAVDFDINVERFSSDSKVTLTPFVYDGEGEWRPLEPVTLIGRRRNISELRSGTQTNGDRRIVRRRKQSAVSYSSSVPYEDWMRYVALGVDVVREECCKSSGEMIEQVSEPVLLRYDVVPAYDVKLLRYQFTELEKYDLENPFLHPMEDYSKRYEILDRDRGAGSSTVVFRSGSSVIDMNVQSNRDVLEALRKAFLLISQDPNATLKHIMIAGYASPEGPLSNNTTLALRRAEAVRKFIEGILDTRNDALFELYNGREDWGGLRREVAASDMEDRDAVLGIIDSYTMEQEVRKTDLKRLDEGRPYARMLAELYPALRSAGYVQVYYEIDRRASVATAIADGSGRVTWIDPDSPANRNVTVFNKAVELMADRRFDEAFAALSEIADDPRAWNNLGVCCMMEGRYDEADVYFRKAAGNGDPNAPVNLEQTAWARKVKERP